MKNYYIDTNCLISFLTDRNSDQQRRVTPFIEDAAARKHNIVLTQHVLTECVYVLSSVYDIPKVHITHMLSAAVQTPGFRVDIGFQLLTVVLAWPHSFSDYGDAVLASAAGQGDGIVLTFDRRFYRECVDAGLQVETP